ncbi:MULTISPECIES: MinD/ParA family protein [unclassified Nostoc]|uniref:MinD/ParA family ATP-binding protein n=1 Tax=unclassified Nostoc TaxID=2593658 RepID=UPI002AD4AE24|nr:MinD/ParA family protein [Nostoc sp. DedQUE03]MDZ7971111.1 MinD/ParA family protein [Nostoc sp. DedQUE03]MDZ8046733.1 MinD/ParA family protein [Nostoc sp. DedQUE02]
MTKIVSVHSFRGGTGKSNLIANLGATIACHGKRVGIIDTDIQSPGIHIIFGLDEKKMQRSLNDYLWGRCSIKETVYNVSHALKMKDQIAVADGSLYLIPSSIKASEISRILREGYDVSRLNDGFEEIIRHLHLDYLLIDTHPGLNEETLLSIAISDILVVIMRPDNQDFQGTAVTVDVARKLEVSKMVLVVNKVLPDFDFDALQQQIETLYNTPVAGIVPLSEELIQLASSDIFCLRHSDHPFSLTVKEIAGQIFAEEGKVIIGGDVYDELCQRN